MKILTEFVICILFEIKEYFAAKKKNYPVIFVMP